MKRFCARHIGIGKQHYTAPGKVGNMLDLQLVILDQLDPLTQPRRLQPTSNPRTSSGASASSRAIRCR